MGITKYLKKAFQQKTKEQKTEQLVALRRQPATVRLVHPTRLDRARALGYKAKQGFFIVQQRVKRGGHERPHYRGGKRTKNATARLALDINYRRIAEERAARKFVNCEVLNSYYVAKDGMYYWYDIIMIDKFHPAIKTDKQVSWITQPQHRGRVFRGLTSAGRKSRGLRYKGKGVEEARPSQAVHGNRL
ncbi:MAG: 50S ribosomal protein L15e [Candidatus Woesearchaeota archaeon]